MAQKSNGKSKQVKKRGDHVKKDKRRGHHGNPAPPGAPQFTPRVSQAPGNTVLIGPGRPQESVPVARRGQDGRGRGNGR